MSEPRKFYRTVQRLTQEQVDRFKDLPADAKLRWLENANRLLYETYAASGNKAPYDPQNWPYL